MALPPALKEKAKEKEEVREGEADMKKGKKDTEIEKGPAANEGVTKANRSTMASLDDENNDSGSKKMDKKGKDCGCDHKNDALTPQEYLAACEGGFQDQSRAYIRARLDAVKREDRAGTGKKCGNSYIPRQANCTNGKGGSASSGSGGKTAKKVKPTLVNSYLASSSALNSIGTALGAAKMARQGNYFGAALQTNNAIGSARATGSFLQNKTAQGFKREFAHRGLSVGLAIGGAAGNTWASTPGAKAMARNAGRSFGNAYANTVGRATQGSRNTAFSMEQRMKGFKKMRRPPGGKLAKRDSVWAAGFGKFDAETALSANSMNLATDKYKGEKRKRNAQGQPRNIIYANTFNT